MRREDAEIFKMTSREILMKLVDFAIWPMQTSHSYRKSYYDYKKWRLKDRHNFTRNILS